MLRHPSALATTALSRSCVALFAALALAPDMGQWSQANLPTSLGSVAATAVGTKAMIPSSTGPSIDIYDDASGLWSTRSLPGILGPYLATTVGSKALFSDGRLLDILTTPPAHGPRLYSQADPQSAWKLNPNDARGSRRGTPTPSTGAGRRTVTPASVPEWGGSDLALKPPAGTFN